MNAAPAPRVLLLGGLDPSGGAGITLDAAVAALHAALPLPIAVTWTEQNRRGFRRAVPVPTEQWSAALAAVCEDGPIAAVKVGLLAAPATVAAVATALARFAGSLPILVDPVLGATAGGLTPGDELPAAYRRHLLPLATLLTPNLPELARLGLASAEQALAAGAGALLLKGGHGEGATSDDLLCCPGRSVVFSRPRLRIGPVRGTGCALATAIACRLAAGVELAAACGGAGDWLAAVLAALPPPTDALPRSLPLHRAPAVVAG